MIRINDKSRDGIYSSNMEIIDNFTDYSSKNLDFNKPVEVEFLDDEENAKNPLGSTAHYNPDEMKITIYVTGRHLKDILRSISHELIHHVQNCRGDLDHGANKLGYAQDDKHMRGMEHEAYTMGNIMNFRDFEDNYKITGVNKMSENKINKLRAMVKEVLNEFSIVGVSSEYRKKAMGSPEEAARFLVSQNNSSYVNDDELDVVYQSVKKWAKRARSKPEVAVKFFRTYQEAGKGRFASRLPMKIRASFAGGENQRRVEVTNDRLDAISKIFYKAVPDPEDDAGGKATKQQAGKAASAAASPAGSQSGGAGAQVMQFPPMTIRGRRSKCPRNITIEIQKKLNELGYKLKPTRRRSDGVDGKFGKNTYDNLVQALDKKVVGRNRFVASKNCKKLLGLLQKAKSASTPGATPAGGAAQAAQAGQAGPTPSSGLSNDLLFNIRTIASREVQDALSRSSALRNVEPKNINKIRVKYREQIAKNVAKQFSDGKLKGELQIQKAVKELVQALAPQMDKEAANFAPKAANKAVKEGIEINFDEFTKTLNEHKNNKLDDRFKKLVKAFKK